VSRSPDELGRPTTAGLDNGAQEPTPARPCSRRRFLGLAATAPLAISASCGSDPQGAAAPGSATVALTRARGYGNAASAAMREAFALLGGIDVLVRGKTVTVKVNLTGWPFQPIGGRSAGESYVTHGDTALALAMILVENGARRVRFVESQAVALPLEDVAAAAGWDVHALQGVAGVEFENTRNLGHGSGYARLPVPDGGRLFSWFDLNHAYAETDVFVSLCKMKEHASAGVTLSMKNLFGLTPNSLYGTEVGEHALGYRFPIHDAAQGGMRLLPGEKPGFQGEAVGVRVPRTIVDLNAARPVDLAIVDGIATVRGGEGWWIPGVAPIAPGVIAVGWNALATDAVCASVMAFDPRAPHGAPPFETRENHLLLAEQAGLGTADLSRIDVRGLRISDVRTPFRASAGPQIPQPALTGPGVPIG
jgi:uncharacterized protein (DUF362 family)